MQGNLIVEKLIKYAEFHLNLDEYDVIYQRNVLLSQLKLNRPYNGDFNFDYIKNLIVPDSIILELKEYILEN
ncbi:MAG TPA: hypothetical protein DEA28_04055, partial [Firmicutes bacterium]|nr:hypothetical protein [Bacillota bacterium]